MVRDKYSSLNAIAGPGFEVQFEGDVIHLAIPEDGISLQNGWEITPLIAPVVSCNKHVTKCVILSIVFP